MTSMTRWERFKYGLGFKTRSGQMRGLLHSVRGLICMVIGCQPDGCQHFEDWVFCVRCWKRVR